MSKNAKWLAVFDAVAMYASSQGQCEEMTSQVMKGLESIESEDAAPNKPISMIDPKDINIRVIDQRIGMGIGGYDTVIRALHVPSGIIVEVPRVTSSQFNDREIAMQMLETAVTHPRFEF